MIERLDEDHERARKLADGLRRVPGLVVDDGSPATNMVYLNLADAAGIDAFRVAEGMKAHGVLVDPDSLKRFRLVTHCWIDDAGVNRTIQAFKEVLAG
jgi:threonine aldolase